MDSVEWTIRACAAVPVASMAAAALLMRFGRMNDARRWSLFHTLSTAALFLSIPPLLLVPGESPALPGLQTSTLGLLLAVLVQLLGTVIGGFSSRYLQGEPGQSRYIASLAGVLASVHLLLLADHWLVLIAAWAMVGVALHPLLCFYAERPFARLAAHKKRLADRLADALLLLAAALAWREVGSGSLSALWAHIEHEGLSPALQASTLALVAAVILRTALMPVHGWLIQVMEAPTPVSALLHAGVVNLGGIVLIRFAPLLEDALLARALLLAVGLATAVLAGMVMLTRVSIKVRLAWSTVAQMGFMLLECALGLYTLAALHLIGHSIYKANAFLSASSIVRQTRLQALHTPASPHPLSLLLAPGLAIGIILPLAPFSGQHPWPAWWNAMLALAWAPLLWLPATSSGPGARIKNLLAGVCMVAGLAAAARLAHALPLGLMDTPHDGFGLAATAGMVVLYAGIALIQWRPAPLSAWRRWSYAGFYLDEAYTRLVLWLWPTRWTPDGQRAGTAH